MNGGHFGRTAVVPGKQGRLKNTLFYHTRIHTPTSSKNQGTGSGRMKADTEKRNAQDQSNVNKSHSRVCQISAEIHGFYNSLLIFFARTKAIIMTIVVCV